MESIRTTSPRRHWLCLLTVVALGIAAPQAGLGAIFENLYTVAVSGDPAASNVRADAMRRGLATVLTRVTGRQDAGAYPEMQALLDSSADYWSLEGRLGGNRWRFEFNATAVNRALTASGMPVWGPERPSTLLWLAVEFPSGNRTELASDSAGGQRDRLEIDQACGTVGGDGQALYATDPLPTDELEQLEQIVTELLAACDERGLPVVVPRLDEIDQSEIVFADVRAAFEDIGFEQYIARAAERYMPDAVLFGRVDLSSGVDARWTQLRGGRVQTLPTQSLRWGIDSLADQYAAEFSIMGDSRVTWITVRDVRDSADYARVMDQVASSSLVESVDVESVSGSDFTLRVVARGDDADLERYLTLDGDLRAAGVAGVRGQPGGLVFVPAWHADTRQPQFVPIPGAPGFGVPPDGSSPDGTGPASALPGSAPEGVAPGTSQPGASSPGRSP